MAKALIVTPDPNNPGGVLLKELWNLAHAGLEDHGVLAVKETDESERVYYAPGAWHSFTRGSARLLEF